MPVDINTWQTYYPYRIYPFAFRKIINGLYLYAVKGKGGNSNWGELTIYDLNELPPTDGDFGWYMSIIDVPKAFDWDADYYNGQDKIIHDNYYISANGALDMTVVRLW